MILRLGRMVHDGVGPLTLEAFPANEDLVDATAFRLQHVGEAASRLSPELLTRHPQVDWSAMVRMRHILAHAYEQVAPRVLWTVAQDHLQPLVNICEAELAGKA